MRNGLNTTIKRQRLSEWIQKQKPTRISTSNIFQYKDIEWQKVNGCEQRKIAIIRIPKSQPTQQDIILISDKGNIKIKDLSIHQEDIANISVYSYNNKISKYMKQKLTELKGEIHKFLIIIRDFNSTLSIIDKIID